MNEVNEVNEWCIRVGGTRAARVGRCVREAYYYSTIVGTANVSVTLNFKWEANSQHLP